MKVLLDECLPRGLVHDLASDHEVITVPDAGWAGKSNGELLRLAVNRFDVFVTADQKLPYQQNLADAQIGVVLVCAGDNRLDTLRRLVPAVLSALDSARPGQIVRVGQTS